MDLMGQTESTASSLFSLTATKSIASDILCPESSENKSESQPRTSSATAQQTSFNNSNKKVIALLYCIDDIDEINPIIFLLRIYPHGMICSLS